MVANGYPLVVTRRPPLTALSKLARLPRTPKPTTTTVLHERGWVQMKNMNAVGEARKIVRKASCPQNRQSEEERLLRLEATSKYARTRVQRPAAFGNPTDWLKALEHDRKTCARRLEGRKSKRHGNFRLRKPAARNVRHMSSPDASTEALARKR